MGNKKATGFLCLRLVPCFAYVGAEDNRKGIPFVKIVSLLCKLIQFLMVALSVTVHKALILLVFLNHPYQSLAFQGFSAFLLSSKRKNNQASLGEVFLFYCCKVFFSYRAIANSSIHFPAESEATSSKRSENSGKNSDFSQENGPLTCHNSEFCGKMRQ